MNTDVHKIPTFIIEPKFLLRLFLFLFYMGQHKIRDWNLLKFRNPKAVRFNINIYIQLFIPSNAVAKQKMFLGVIILRDYYIVKTRHD